MIIQISLCGDVTVCTENGDSIVGSEYQDDMLDCASSGDCEPACQYVRDHIKPKFRIVARNSEGAYQNREATPKEKQACCEEIYFESDVDFSDESTAETYLIWQAASGVEYEFSNGEG